MFPVQSAKGIIGHSSQKCIASHFSVAKVHWTWYNAVASKHYTVQGAFAGVDVVPTLSFRHRSLRGISG